MGAPVSAAIDIDGLHVSYGNQRVLHGVDLKVAPGEFVAILGSSGCGKTTLLRTIAGFQKASQGAIRLFGRDVVNMPPEKRGMAMMFQSYALWPHMTVLGNVGYGLRLRGVGREEIRTRVADDPEDAQPVRARGPQGDESVGRTAPARGARPVACHRAGNPAARRALSNLDAKVRIQLRSEIKALQNRLGFTAIHVTPRS